MAQYIARTITVGLFARPPKTNPLRRPRSRTRRPDRAEQAERAAHPRWAALKPADTASCSEQNQRSPRAFCTRDALVVRRPGQDIDARRARDLPLDRAAFRRAALGLLPYLRPVVGRALGIAGGPQAGLGGARLPLLAGVAREMLPSANTWPWRTSSAPTSLSPTVHWPSVRPASSLPLSVQLTLRPLTSRDERRLRRGAAPPRPAALAAALLALGRIDAGQPDGGTADAQRVAHPSA